MARDLTSTEAAEILGVHADTLNRWADDGLVPYWMTPGGQKRYRLEDIEKIREPITAPRKAVGQ